MNFIKKIYTEITNYQYLKRVVRKQETSTEWQIFNLRRDWIYRIYTVVNLEQDFIDQVSEFEITHAIIDQISPINKYLSRLDFGEIVLPEVTRVEGTNSWLVVYNPRFDVLTVKHVLITSVAITASFFGFEYRLPIEHLIQLL
jgi:hypothetical protein